MRSRERAGSRKHRATRRWAVVWAKSDIWWRTAASRGRGGAAGRRGFTNAGAAVHRLALCTNNKYLEWRWEASLNPGLPMPFARDPSSFPTSGGRWRAPLGRWKLIRNSTIALTANDTQRRVIFHQADVFARTARSARAIRKN